MSEVHPGVVILVVLIVAFGLWGAVQRVLDKPLEQMTMLDRLTGSVLLGKWFARLHARRHPPKAP